MADTDLGELRRPARPIEQRIERIARWRAQGLAGGQADSTFPSDATDAAVFASGGDTSVVTGGGGAGAAKWEYDTFSLTSASENAFTLTAVPVEKSEVVRVNGLVLSRSEYTIASNILTFTDLAAVRLGIGADTWTLSLNYAYTDLASPAYDVPVTADAWSYNGTAFLEGTTPRLNQGGTSGSEAGSMVTVDPVPAGWSTITLAISITLDVSAFAGHGIAFGLLDSSEAETYVGQYGNGLGVGTSSGDPTDTVPCALGWVDTETFYTGTASVNIGSRSIGGTTTTLDTDAGLFADNGANDYEITFTATTAGRASAVLKWNGTTVLSSTTDLYVPATPRIIIAAGSGSSHQQLYVTSVAVTTDASDPVIAVPGGTYTPPTPPSTPGTHVLRYQRPDTTGYTTLDVVAGGTFNLDNGTDYAITASGPIDSNYVRLVGGRNLDVYGLIFDFDPAVPTGSYDADRRGLHIKDGPNPDLKRVIYIEGLYLRSGYYSDGIQVALRHENDVTLIVQAMRSDAKGWGQRSGVHSDLIQFYGGPLNFFGDCITGTYQTYQGIFMRPADGRSLPSGADKEDWQLSRVNLESGDGPSGGAHYLLWDDQPAWTGLTLDEVYITGASGYDVTDGNGNMPSSGLFQNATPSGGDWAPSSWWVGDTYTSPGYV